MKSKNWKSLMVWLRTNTTAQPHEIETPEDALAVAFLKFTEGFNMPDRAMWMATADANGVSPDVAVSEFELISGKEYHVVPFSSVAPEGDGWTLHSSTSFDATWVRDAPRFDYHRYPGCDCPDGTVAADCPGLDK